MNLLIEHPCRKCGIATKRLKYCLPCSKAVKHQQVQAYNSMVKNVYVNKVEQKNFEKHYMKDFTWDNPNDPLFA